VTLSGSALYVHFPWCVRKCPYCDFNSHRLTGELPESAYVDALEMDLESQRKLSGDLSLGSIFFGGGTPSLFGPESFVRLIGQAGDSPVEVTLEANPGTAEFHSFSAYRAAGINRLSLGAQSFSNDMLQRLGRIHCADETRRAFFLAREGGFDNINLDLMYGLPGQNAEGAIADLMAALELGPEHLSWYELTLEPKTEFFRRPPRLPPEDTMAAIEDAGHALLRAHGYERYEVSAWAKPGRQCMHNLNYWQFGDYLGIGAGAHGKLTGKAGIVRTRKAPQPRLYLRNPGDTQRIRVAGDLLIGEFMLNVLRLSEGVPTAWFESRTGLSLDRLEPAWTRGVEDGLLRRDRLATTPLGFRYLDSVLQRFL